MEKFYSHGKLLLTGEYLALDGAIALAVPTKFGQSLDIEGIEATKLQWQSLDEKGNIWFEDTISFKDISEGFATPKNEISERLLQILRAAKKLNPTFLEDQTGYKIKTLLEFPKDWGLGTSSTLINNIATWANVDAYKLLESTFGGSGYDIACAQHATPISYQLKNDKQLVKPISFNPVFKEHLYFVYLNKKQNSRDGIAVYKENKGNLSEAIQAINSITQNMISCTSLEAFNVLLEQHEQLISKIIKQEPIKQRLFSDFKGCIKSLGAWGGDFVLVTSINDPREYFNRKGYTTILTYEEMVLNPK
ncbi:mevalonate kinase [Oceanihabitans sediminis]|uniref:GHMP kinase n=1 Tax=Oceanihabitans sediminis TaxID=1812012 RepID=A0A368P9T7_9FLAO|nr:GYDIA family GHMP kinase [Oceanihabitans sediminis]RBP32040.1 mevalonate kinase [Oceanihabitans sediminis]RCU58695.1 GHMP kinase [Oceanihabitans sediminis]